MSDRYDPPYLDDEEREIMESLDRVDGEQVERPSKERVHELRKAARDHLNRASAKMNIRISPEELELIKERADREGLKYQTLVKSVLHKYVTGQLVDSERGSA
jgi:predicted DNA binding CopG/RHH family protein